MSSSKKSTDYDKRLLRCGGLVFDPVIGKANGNKNQESVFFRRNKIDRKLLEYLLVNGTKDFVPYNELLLLINKPVIKDGDKGVELRKAVNDKIEALKRKLLKLGFDRNELASMFICDQGYMLLPPREGKKRV